jgi:hypothetical protein
MTKAIIIVFFIGVIIGYGLASLMTASKCADCIAERNRQDERNRNH